MASYLQSNIMKKIRQLFSAENWEEIRQIFSLMHIPKIVEIFNQSSKSEQKKLISLLSKIDAARVFRRLDIKDKKILLKELSKKKIEDILLSLKPDERVNLFQELPKVLSKQLLDMLSPEDLAKTKQLLQYPRQTIGRLMTPNFVAVKKEWDVKKALDHIKFQAKVSETINNIFVIDEEFRLIGQVGLDTLVLAEKDSKINDIIDKRIATVKAEEDQEVAVNFMNEQRLAIAPVVNKDEKLIGIITIDDVLEIAQKETSEDIYKGSAIIPIGGSYRKSNVRSLFKKRIGWLLVLVLLSLVASGIIAGFEETLSKAIKLTFFIPLLIAAGGNVGSQSATLIIRAISLGEIKVHNWLKTLGKEIMVGVLLALTLGIISSLMGIFSGGLKIGIILGLSMAVVIVITNILGVILPFLLNKLKVDPAVASGPLVASMADVIGLTIYFTFANLILGNIS